MCTSHFQNSNTIRAYKRNYWESALLHCLHALSVFSSNVGGHVHGHVSLWPAAYYFLCMYVIHDLTIEQKIDIIYTYVVLIVQDTSNRSTWRHFEVSASSKSQQPALMKGNNHERIVPVSLQTVDMRAMLPGIVRPNHLTFRLHPLTLPLFNDDHKGTA